MNDKAIAITGPPGGSGFPNFERQPAAATLELRLVAEDLLPDQAKKR